METITSRSNPRIKQVRALRQRKARQDGGLFLIEGIRHVGEAVEAGLQIEMILYAPERLHSDYAQELIQEQTARGVACQPVSLEVFKSLAEKDYPAGLLAVARQPSWQLRDLGPDNFPWGVALVDPQDPGNVGTVARTIDATGASGLLLLASNPDLAGLVDPFHPSALRASMGASFWHPVLKASFADFLSWANSHGYHLYGTSARAAVHYQTVHNYQLPCILLLGSERAGLSAEQAASCELLIQLPMHGSSTSLNLAVAAGVMLYDMLAKLNYPPSTGP